MSKIAFVCVGNAGRSQMAAALARRERDERDLDLDIVTGGVDPADSVHDEVVEALADVGIDIGDREPRAITEADVADADYVVTMGCSADEFVPEGWDGTALEWELEAETPREQLDELDRRIGGLFDRLETKGVGHE